MMEYLAQLYEERVEELKEMFLSLLNNLEESKLFASKPSLAQYRIEYVGAMVTEAFKTEQEKTIQRLLRQVSQLKKKLEEKDRDDKDSVKNRSHHYQFSNCESSGSLSWENSEERQRKIVTKPQRVNFESKQWGTPDTKLSTFSDWTDQDNMEIGRKNSSIEDSITSCNFKYLKLKF